MAYNFPPAINSWFSTNSTPVTGQPITMAAFMRMATGASNRTILSVATAATVNSWMRIYVSNANSYLIAEVSDGANISASTRFSAIAASVWRHGCGVFAASNSVQAYLDGVAASVNASSFSLPAAPTAIGIGSKLGINPGNAAMQGQIAEPAIWNVALTADEILSLSRGVSPLKVRPQSLVFYAPLMRNAIDVWQGRSLTATGNLTAFDHPRVYA